MADKDFNLVQNEEKEVEITQEDFKLAVRDDKSHEQKFETKPTTFLKDSMKRFSRNKSSVVASYILGFLILLAIFVPIISPFDVSVPEPKLTYLQPKLFPSGTGFWDGVKTYENVAYDHNNQSPDTSDFVTEAVVKDSLVLGEIEKIDAYNQYAWGGYLKYAVNGNFGLNYVVLESTPTVLPLNTIFGHTLDIKFADKHGSDDYQLGDYRLYMSYLDENGVSQKVYLTEYAPGNKPLTLDVNKALKDGLKSAGIAEPTNTAYEKTRFGIELDNSDKTKDKCVFIEGITITTTSKNKDYTESITAPSFDDANEFIARNKTTSEGYANYGYWSSTGDKFLYQANFQRCSFKYDTYAAKLGKQRMLIGQSEMEQYISQGWVEYNNTIGISSFKVLDEKHCPIIKIYEQTVNETGPKPVIQYDCDVLFYKYKGFTSMPVYLFGTDSAGRDMFKYVFEGLRTSLLLGVITFIVCFLFGLCWGSISGYFGGNIDLAMERFTDILSGVPWIVVMTLCIIHLGSNFATFALALCLTGWIGISHLTRTQFYRFKGREYVLASRTLGSSDIRLIFKHILPNAMGTIITSAVLMIPSVIFSEATISYLGLGLQGLSSLGVILSDNQKQLLSNPHLLIFPSVVIALIMISFNLFGNGLRDAINPSLKGEGE